MIHRTRIELTGAHRILHQRFIGGWPACEVNDWHGSAGAARGLVQKFAVGFLPRAAPQVYAEDEHALGGRVADLMEKKEIIFG